MPLKNGGPVVGLDIGSSFIKACEIDVRGGRANLRGIAVIPTPPEAVANNEIIDPVLLGKAIRQVLQQSGIKAKRAVTCVSGQSSLVVRIIEVPKMTRKELEETMKWEIERHVPFAAEQVVMDYQPLVPPEEVPDGQNMEVLLAVAQEALVTRHIEALQAAGLQALAIDIEPLASPRALLDLANGAGPTGTVAIVDMGASTTDISIYREGRIAFTRSIQIAGNNLTKAIADVLGRPLAEAEELKKQMAGLQEQAPAGGGLDPNAFGDLQTIDFGLPGADPMGGTFGMAPDPGASTATDTQTEETIDIAGGGMMSADLFTSAPPSLPAGDAGMGLPGFGVPPPGGEMGSIFDQPAAAPIENLDPALLAGPSPVGNPFAPQDDPPPVPAAGPAGASPFDPSLFGPTPGANPFEGQDPFAPVDDLGSLSMPTGGMSPAAMGVVPAAMSEEEYLKTQVADAIMPVFQELVTELRRSLDFYRNRANGLGAQQVVITGGTAKVPGLTEYLALNLEAPVAIGNPLEYLSTGTKADPSYLQDVGPHFPVSVGLAIRELLTDPAPARKKR